MEIDTSKDKRKMPNPVPVHRLLFCCDQITCVHVDGPHACMHGREFHRTCKLVRHSYIITTNATSCIISYGYVGTALAHHLVFLVSLMCRHFRIDGWQSYFLPAVSPEFESVSPNERL